MSRWRTALEPSPELADVFPTVLSASDPCAGDEHLMAPAIYAGYRLYCPHDVPLSEPAHAALDARFCEGYRAILDGRAGWSSLDGVVAALGLSAPLSLDRRPVTPSASSVATLTLAEMCEDYVPEVAVFAPERVLGPFAPDALPRWLFALSGAVMSFTPLLRGGVMPLSRAVIYKPKPPTVLADAIRSAVRSPPMLWSVDGAVLSPLLPLSPRLQLSGAISGIPDGAAALVGRLVPRGDGGGWLCCVLPLAVVPDPAVLLRRLMLEVWRLRRHDVRATWEDILRDRSEVLYRAVCEWCWWHHPSETRALWQRL